MRISIVALLPAAAALALAPRTAAAQREFHWKGPVAPGKAIEIKGVNGDVRASAGSGDVEVTAVKRAQERPRRGEDRGRAARRRGHDLRRVPERRPP